jgi:hypothetical protein
LKTNYKKRIWGCYTFTVRTNILLKNNVYFIDLSGDSVKITIQHGKHFQTESAGFKETAKESDFES